MSKAKRKRKIISAGSSLLIICTGVSLFLLTLCGLSTFVSPARFPLLGAFVLGFPFFLFLAVATTVVCALLRVRRWWIAVLVLLANVWCIRVYIPVNLPQKKDPQGAFVVVSFNVENLAKTGIGDSEHQQVARYLVESEADIVCLQEAPRHNEAYFKYFLPVMRERFAYADSLELEKSSYLNIFSRLKIVGSELVARGKNNHCVAYTLLDDDGDTLYVVNCHLTSMHLSPDEKQGFSGMVHNTDILSTAKHRQEGVTLLTKISAAAVERAEQVDKLCQFLERTKGKRVILCGDFNDTPISYAHNRVSAFLKDCYAATATGLGRSFNQNSMLVRIDHMFCSSHFKPSNCQIDQSIFYSDHYPIRCAFVKNK